MMFKVRNMLGAWEVGRMRDVSSHLCFVIMFEGLFAP